jgi:hypothetical protein
VLQTSTSPPTFAVQPRYGTASDFTANVIAIGDLNGDRRPDVVVGNSSSNVEVFMQTSVPGTYRPGVAYVLPTRPTIGSGSVNAVSIADLNGDTLPDIAASNDDIFVLFQDQGSPGRFESPVRIAGSVP